LVGHVARKARSYRGADIGEQMGECQGPIPLSQMQ